MDLKMEDVEVKIEPEDADYLDSGVKPNVQQVEEQIDEFRNKKRRKKSAVWQHFNINGLPKRKAKCNFCRQIVSFSADGNSNLRRHLKVRHGIDAARLATEQVSVVSSTQYNSPKAGKKPAFASPKASAKPKPTKSAKPAISATSGPSTSSKPAVPATPAPSTSSATAVPETLCWNPENKQLNEALVRLLAQQNLPLELVDSKEFHKFCELLHKNPYQIPSRKTLTESLIPGLCVQIRQSLKERLKIASYVCITTDTWASCTMDNFVAVTAHWIENGVLSSGILKCMELSAAHTIDSIRCILASVFEEWVISHKIVCIVTDDASNVCQAISNGIWKHLLCFTHILNSIVLNSMYAIRGSVEKVRNIVTYFRQSTTAKTLLEQHLVQNSSLELKEDVTNRWQSTFTMLQRALQWKEALKITLPKIVGSPASLNYTDWMVISEACEVLQVFEEIAGEASTEEIVTVAKVIPFVSALKTAIIGFEGRYYFTQPVKDMVKVLWMEVSTRFQDLENEDSIIAEAAILDPRIKNFGFYEGKKAAGVVRVLKCKVRGMAAAAPTVDKPKSIVWRRLQENAKRVKHLQPPATGVQEVDRYMAEPIVDDMTDPLKWWEQNKTMFPKLYDLAQNRLCIAATSPTSYLHSSEASELIFLKNL